MTAGMESLFPSSCPVRVLCPSLRPGAVRAELTHSQWGGAAGQSDKSPIALPASSFTKTSAVKRPSCDDLLQAGITDLMKTTAARLRGQPCKTHYGETTQHLREQLKRRKDFFGCSFRV